MNTDDLIKKWLNEDLSANEKQAFEAMEEAPFYQRIIDDAAKFKASQFVQVDDFDTFKKKNMVSPAKVRKLHWSTPMLRIASVMAVVFGLYYFFFMNNLTQVQTQIAQKTTIELPDQSRVVLNAQSEVAYDQADWNEKREVKLNGEAFFDVAKGSKFDVVTPDGTVSVLGTEFNVKQRKGYFEVTCYEGTVRVVSQNQTQILHQGDSFRILDGQVRNTQHTLEEPQWTNNMSSFDRVPMTEVFDELERQFGVTVAESNVNDQALFTGVFTHNDLESAIKAIGTPMGLDYQILKGQTVRFSIRD